MKEIIESPTVEKKVHRFAQAGPDQIHVLSDFDNTLTKAFVDGERVSSLIAELRNEGYLGEEYTQKSQALFDQYYPYEIDPTLSEKERATKLLEWWNLHFDLLIESGVTREILSSAAINTDHTFRDEAKTLFTLLDENDIPLVILSAGMGDMIIPLLASGNLLTEDVHVVSNFLSFDGSGRATGVIPPVIHTLNKHEIILKKYPLYDQIKDRKYVIVMGDNIGDLGMIEGFEYEEMISIGFYNEKDAHFEEYKNAFDVVITGDGSLEYVVDLVKKLIG